MYNDSNRNLFQNTSEERNKIVRHIQILLRYKWAILSTFFLILTIVFFYTKKQPYIYQSTVSIIVKSDRITAGVGIEDFSGNATENINNELEILKSRSLLKTVAEKLYDKFYITSEEKKDTLLVLKSAFYQTGASSLDTPEFLDKIMRSTLVRTSFDVGKTNNVLKISVKSPNPAEAAITANIYADTYYEKDLKRTRSNASEIKLFIEKQLEKSRRDLAESEKELQDFMEKEGVSELGRQSESLITRISELETQIEKNQIEYETSALKLENYIAELKRITPLMTDKIVNVDDMYIKELQKIIAIKESELDISKIVSGSESKNPDFIRQIEAKQSAIDSLRSILEQRTNQYIENSLPNISFEGISKNDAGNIISQLTGEIHSLKLKTSSLKLSRSALQKQLEKYQKQFGRLPQQSITLSKLRNEKERNEQIVLNYIKQYEDARLGEQSTFGNIQIIDRAVKSSTPISPRLMINMLVGAILGLLFGVIIAYLLNFMFHYVRTPQDVESLGFRLISTIPKLQSSNGNGKLLGSGEDISNQKLLSAKSSYSIAMESFQRLQIYLSYGLLDKNIKSLVVTSSGPGEGKSGTASNLAINLADSGKKVLLVDTDMRKPAIHKYFNVSPKPSLVHYLYGKCTFEEIIKKSDVDGLDFITSIEFAENPALVLTSKKMISFMKKVDEIYDFVIYDSPPVNAVTDAIHLAKNTDEVILIARADKTNVEELRRANQIFEQFHIKIGGVVLNDYDNSKLSSYYGQYYGFYSSENSKSMKRKSKVKNINIRNRNLLRPNKTTNFSNRGSLNNNDLNIDE
ncbi:MAG: polysaccharide biosynthesis tyrosine autokinase [Ignavibacteriae bacterium]|nr:polysaccharide biosynthesis tyrosine autokinase [Ignavibacteriota bacterium]NOH00050.1 polysaccharide biosynthesis tyrosine autokinase [Ignavibacteriota bacterium]